MFTFTGQEDEIIKIGGKTCCITYKPSCPLSNYLKDKGYKFDDPQGADEGTKWTCIVGAYDNRKRGIRGIFGSPDCTNGYFAKWGIKNNELHLIGFESIIIIKDQDDNIVGKKVDLSYLFPNATSVKADWFTGCIEIEDGEKIGNKSCGTTFSLPIYSDLTEIEIEQGNIIKTTNKHFTPEDIQPEDTQPPEDLPF